jgi:hypothetical protein
MVKPKTPDRLDWVQAAAIVSLAFVLVGGIGALPVPFVPKAVRAVCLLLLAFPGLLFVLPFIIHNIHNADNGFFASAIALNWMIYTLFVRWALRRRRRNRGDK